MAATRARPAWEDEERALAAAGPVLVAGLQCRREREGCEATEESVMSAPMPPPRERVQAAAPPRPVVPLAMTPLETAANSLPPYNVDEKDEATDASTAMDSKASFWSSS